MMSETLTCIYKDHLIGSGRLGEAVRAATKKGNSMPFNRKFRLFANGGNLLRRQADIDLDDAMAIGAGKVMVMHIATDAIVVRAISEIDTVEQAHIDKL